MCPFSKATDYTDKRQLTTDGHIYHRWTQITTVKKQYPPMITSFPSLLCHSLLLCYSRPLFMSFPFSLFHSHSLYFIPIPLLCHSRENGNPRLPHSRSTVINHRDLLRRCASTASAETQRKATDYTDDIDCKRRGTIYCALFLKPQIARITQINMSLYFAPLRLGERRFSATDYTDYTDKKINLG